MLLAALSGPLLLDELEWPLLGAVALGLLLLSQWHRLSGTFPRLTAFCWPHLPVGAVLLLVSLLLFQFVFSLLLLLWRWSGDADLWDTLSGRSPSLRALDWLFPWFPTLLCFFLVFLLAARTLSRRLFHFMAVLALSSIVLGVVLHEEPSPGLAGPSHSLLDSRPPDSSWTLLAPGQLQRPELLRLDAAWRLSSGLELLPLHDALALERAWEAPLSARLPPVGVRRSIPEIAAERFSSRVLQPIVHQRDIRADVITVTLMGVLLLFGFSWLDRLNFGRFLQPIRGVQITDGQEVNGSPRTRPDLEMLMREFLHRHTLHTPPPLPGGALGYWQDFVEQQSVKDNHWFTRVVAFAMRLLHPPAGLEIRGALIPEERGRRTAKGTPRHGIRVHMVDSRTGHTLLASSFYSDINIEEAVMQAAFSAAERAIEQCRELPDWVYWKDDDGSALRLYHQASHVLQTGYMNPKALEEVRRRLQEAVRENPGCATLHLRLAEVLEASRDFVGAITIYLAVIERHPRLLEASLRLAFACQNFQWVFPLAEEPGGEGMSRLRQVLEGDVARSLRGPTLLSRLVELNRRSAVSGSPPRVKRRVPIPIDSRDTSGLVDVLLVMSARCLKQVENALKWRILFRGLLHTSERRLLWHSWLWPPQKRRDIQLSVWLARCRVEWWQFRRVQQLRRIFPSEPLPLPWRLVRAIHRLEFGLLARWRHHRLERAALLTTLATRVRPNWLGGAHYHLAGFYAMRVEDELYELPASIVSPDWWRMPGLLAERGETPIRKAREVLSRLSSVMETPARSVEDAVRWYLEDSRTAAGFDFESPRDLAAERAQSLAQLSSLAESVANMGKPLPGNTKALRMSAAWHCLALEWLSRRELRKLHDVAAQLRQQARAFLDTQARRGHPLAREWEVLVEGCAHELEQLSQERRSDRHEEQCARAADLRERLRGARAFLQAHAAELRGPGDDVPAVGELLHRFEGVEAWLAHLHDLSRLAMKFQELNEGIQSLRELYNRAQSIQRLRQHALGHLSISMRERSGPFTSITTPWLLIVEDFEALHPDFGAFRHA